MKALSNIMQQGEIKYELRQMNQLITDQESVPEAEKKLKAIRSKVPAITKQVFRWHEGKESYVVA